MRCEDVEIQVRTRASDRNDPSLDEWLRGAIMTITAGAARQPHMIPEYPLALGARIHGWKHREEKIVARVQRRGRRQQFRLRDRTRR